MILSAIVVTDLNNAIGKDNKLLCHLPADLKFFKSTTMGCP
ncbi:MAG TPA: dihydrofolate reductase, partial [Bacteroidia bacterium]|nr:dihydrofolate reductase [Bacteroidia bacterium]